MSGIHCSISGHDCNHHVLKELATNEGYKCIYTCCIQCKDTLCGYRCNGAINKPNEREDTNMAKKTTTKTAAAKEISSENITINFRPFENGNTKGFADVTFYDAITIYGCSVVEGKNGIFLSYPSHKGKDGKYYNYAYVNKDDELAEELNNLVATLL